ncbi:MAG: thiamine pyrophosphate-binding protein [Deltaproteobacteria bacterium]|nr:thiamine pyrophosphate-binding protein [Deltaproteobacteria bacterium]
MSKQELISVTAAEAFVRCLVREGVDTTFGIASGYLSPFLDAMRRAGVKVVTNLHEGAAGCAAAGYTMASGKLGVLYAQSGPGVTNAVTGVAAAYMDSIPMLLVATQAPSNLYGRDGHQEVSGAVYGIDQLDMFTTMTAVRYRPPNGEALIRLTRRAFAAMWGRRSTAAIEVAADHWSHKVNHEDLAPEQYRAASSAVDVQGIAQVAELLRNAKAPALLIGHRAIHRGASADLVALCEEQDIPCATVDFAKGAIPEDHAMSLGVLGSCGHDSASSYFQHADLVIALGTRMSSQTTLDFDPEIFPNLVHIDEVAEEPGRNLKLRLGIISDIPGAVRALRAASGEPRKRGSAERVRGLRIEHNVYGVPKGRPATSTPAVLAAVREVLPRDTLVTGDSGLTLQYVKHFFPIYAADGFFALYSMAPMGSGLPLAIGVQMGRPNDTVLCVIGDGGTLVHLSELAVAAHYGLPLIVLICNNGGYRQVGDRMERYQSESYGCFLPEVDFVAAARACGCDAYQADDAESAATAVRAALERRKASVIEVRVKGDNVFDITPERIKKWWDRMFLSSSPDANRWPFPKS